MTEPITQFWTPYLWGLAASSAGFALLWPLSVLRRDASVVDFWWGPGFAVLLWTAVYAAGAHPGPHGWAALGLVSLWAPRLCWTMGMRRLRAGEEDPRYVAMREARGRSWWWKCLLHVFALQALIQGVLVAPVAATALAAPVAAGPLLALGALIAAVGLTLETAADMQLDRWQATRPGTLCTGGLRRIVRHPNYSGEILFWTGIALIGLDAGVIWAPATPIMLAALLGWVSGRPMLEERLTRHPGWAAYAARTPAFVPRLRPPQARE
jgi:steroid 5-alpha reductase family enzyme